MAIEAEDMLKKSGIYKEIVPATSQYELDQMIDNYLANERNIIILSGGISNDVALKQEALPPTECYDTTGSVIPCPITLEGVTVNCTGTFSQPNTSNTIAFSGTINNASTLITGSAFAFGGIGGTWTPFGTLSQSLHQGVITYRRNYQEQYTVNGVTYTQLYAIVGNVYNGQCTVHGIRIVASN